MRGPLMRRLVLGLAVAALSIGAFQGHPTARAAGAGPSMTMFAIDNAKAADLNYGRNTEFRLYGTGFTSGGAVQIRVLDSATGVTVGTWITQASVSYAYEDGTLTVLPRGRVVAKHSYTEAGDISPAISVAIPCATLVVSVQAIDLATGMGSNAMSYTNRRDAC